MSHSPGRGEATGGRHGMGSDERTRAAPGEGPVVTGCWRVLVKPRMKHSQTIWFEPQSLAGLWDGSGSDARYFRPNKADQAPWPEAGRRSGVRRIKRTSP